MKIPRNACAALLLPLFCTTNIAATPDVVYAEYFSSVLFSVIDLKVATLLPDTSRWSELEVSWLPGGDMGRRCVQLRRKSESAWELVETELIFGKGDAAITPVSNTRPIEAKLAEAILDEVRRTPMDVFEPGELRRDLEDRKGGVIMVQFFDVKTQQRISGLRRKKGFLAVESLIRKHTFLSKVK